MATQSPPCPYCSGASYRRIDERWLACKECGHEFDLHQDLCRACGRLNQAGATTCAHCQAPLTKKDLASKVIDVRSRTRQDWLAERGEISQEQKKQEEVASRRRMEAYWEQENVRQQAVAAALAKRQKRERQMIVIAGVVLGVITLIAIITVLIMMLT